MSQCGSCGAPARPSFRRPRAESAPDLDMRPGEPARSTLRDWVAICGGCGAAAADLSVLTARDRAVVESDAYRMLRTLAPEESLPFRQWALICAHTAGRLQQAEALLQAAWAADDVAAMTSAAEPRSEVAALWAGTADVVLGLRRLDVLRRAGLFEAAAA